MNTTPAMQTPQSAQQQEKEQALPRHVVQYSGPSHLLALHLGLHAVREQQLARLRLHLIYTLLRDVAHGQEHRARVRNNPIDLQVRTHKGEKNNGGQRIP